jgi:hypothetical protein
MSRSEADIQERPAPAEPPSAPRRADALLPWTWNPFVALWRFWVRPMRAEPLAAFRITLGATILLSAAFSILGSFDLYLGENGLCPPDGLKPWLQRTNRFCLLVGPVGLPPKDLMNIGPLQRLRTWIPYEEEVSKDARPADKPEEASPEGKRLAETMGVAVESWGRSAAREFEAWGRRPSSALLLVWIWLFVTATMTVGLFTRTSTVLCWALAVTFHHRLTWLNNGGDALFRVGLFYLMLAPAGAAWSLDALWRRAAQRRRAIRRGQPPPEEPPPLIAPWTVRLLQIQLCIVYIFTGLVKFVVDVDSPDWHGNDWITGRAVYWVLNDLTLNRLPYFLYAPAIPLFLCKQLTWATLLFELYFSFFVCLRRLRPLLLLGGVLFHLGILIHTEVGFFSQVTLAFYPLFLSGPLLARWARRLGFPAAKETEAESAEPPTVERSLPRDLAVAFLVGAFVALVAVPILSIAIVNLGHSIQLSGFGAVLLLVFGGLFGVVVRSTAELLSRLTPKSRGLWLAFLIMSLACLAARALLALAVLTLQFGEEEDLLFSYSQFVWNSFLTYFQSSNTIGRIGAVGPLSLPRPSFFFAVELSMMVVGGAVGLFIVAWRKRATASNSDRGLVLRWVVGVILGGVVSAGVLGDMALLIGGSIGLVVIALCDLTPQVRSGGEQEASVPREEWALAAAPVAADG